jgi:hypothetical protein
MFCFDLTLDLCLLIALAAMLRCDTSSRQPDALVSVIKSGLCETYLNLPPSVSEKIRSAGIQKDPINGVELF